MRCQQPGILVSPVEGNDGISAVKFRALWQ